MFLDLEYTAWEGSAQRGWSLDWEHRKLIQIRFPANTRSIRCDLESKPSQSLFKETVLLEGSTES